MVGFLHAIVFDCPLEGSNGLMAIPAVMDLIADSQDEPGSGGSALFSEHIHSHKIMEADRCSSGVEAKRIPAEKIIIFACDTTDVAEGREVNIKRWEV